VLKEPLNHPVVWMGVRSGHCLGGHGGAENGRASRPGNAPGCA
jgi:hypothetical protein